MAEIDMYVHLLARSTVVMAVAVIRLAGVYSKSDAYMFSDMVSLIRKLFNPGEVAKLFADAGLICVASLISPYRRDRDTCRAMLPDANFIEERLRLAFLISCLSCSAGYLIVEL